TCQYAPPFSKEKALLTTNTTLPHCFRDGNQLSDPSENIQEFLRAELQTTKLNKAHKYLWLAGLPRPARPLHRQQLLLRNIYPTESPDEHLVWHDKCIFIKPMPEYLLSYEFWVHNLSNDDALHENLTSERVSFV
ncbi:hypothetical protein EDB81DRAFT_628182, partial [Dactylonectria macrodidyma]